MDIFDVFMLLGGLAFFLFGMNVMSGSLEKLAGGRLEHTLRKLTSNPLKSILLGAGITIAIQSSSAMTVMLVGFVNSGILELSQTVSVMMGSNIGTTLTAWLLSLTGITSDNFFLKLLQPESFSPLVAVIGVVLIMISKKKTRRKDIGTVLVGFAILMYGMTFMSSSVAGLKESEAFQGLLVAFANPLIALLIGTVFTGIIQSSAATVGIILALSLTGSISYTMAIPLILGANIGTCATALLSCIGVNKDGKRVAVIHITIKIIGAAVCMAILYGLDAIFRFPFMQADSMIDPVGVAVVHTAFNVISTLMLLPFTKQLVGLSRVIVRDKKTQESYEILDERLMRSPSIAIAECRNVTRKMADLAYHNLLTSIGLIYEYDPRVSDEVTDTEEKIDTYEDKLGTFLVKLSRRELSDAESNTLSELLHTISDFERIGDHAVNIQRVALEMYEKKVSFSAPAKADVEVVVAAVEEILSITMKSFDNDDSVLATKVEPLEQVIDGLISDSKDRHIVRLTNGNCTIELGFILSDLLTNFSRVSDHCSNIAVAIIQTRDSSFDTHGYLNEIKSGKEPEFVEEFAAFKEKYRLPEVK